MSLVLDLFYLKTVAKEIKKTKKQKENKTEHKLICSLPRPSYCEAQPTQPSASRPPPLDRRTRGRVPTARRHAPATSCLPARRWRHPRAPRTPLNPLHLSPLSQDSLSFHCSLPQRHRVLPSTPLATTAATSIPAAFQLAHKLRLGSIKLYADARDAGCPEATPSPPSSPPWPAIAAARFAATRTSPSTPRPPLHPP